MIAFVLMLRKFALKIKHKSKDVVIQYLPLELIAK